MSADDDRRRTSRSSCDHDQLWLDYHQHLLKSAILSRKWRGIVSDEFDVSHTADELHQIRHGNAERKLT